VLHAAIPEVSVRIFTLPNLGYCCLGGTRVCWFCSDCCWCFSTYRGW